MPLFQNSLLKVTVILVVSFVPWFAPVSAASAISRLLRHSSANVNSYQSNQTADNPEVRIEGENAIYSGELNSDGLLRLKKLTDNQKIRTLIIKSGGGDVSTGIDFGNWVFDNKLDLTVKEGCFSSCANYVFPAGRKKTILPGAIVAWHGSALQGNFQSEDTLRKEVEKSYKRDKIKVSEEQKEKDVKKYMSDLLLLREKQTAFYKRIGVDEYVTRIGQEEYGAKGFYFLSVEDMKRFGISNVTAPDNYTQTDLTELKKRIKVPLVYVKLK